MKCVTGIELCSGGSVGIFTPPPVRTDWAPVWRQSGPVWPVRPDWPDHSRRRCVASPAGAAIPPPAVVLAWKRSEERRVARGGTKQQVAAASGGSLDPRACATATVLAEAGQPLRYNTWLVRAARSWSSLVAAPAGSLMRSVLKGGLQQAATHGDAPLHKGKGSRPSGNLHWEFTGSSTSG